MLDVSSWESVAIETVKCDKKKNHRTTFVEMFFLDFVFIAIFDQQYHLADVRSDLVGLSWCAGAVSGRLKFSFP